MTTNNNKKTKITSYGITVGTQVEKQDHIVPKEIELLGANHKTLQLANSFFPDMPKEFDLKEQIPLETLFFYKVEGFDKQSYPKRELLLAEVGIGCLIKKGRKTFLQRIHPKRHFSQENGHLETIKGRLVDFSDHPHLIITSAPPTTLDDLFSFKNSVICSLGDGCPEIVVMEDNSVLGMIDGDLKNIKGGELKKVISPEVLRLVLLENDLPLTTNANKLELKAKHSNISSNSIQLRPERSRPTKPQAGMIIFNSRTKKFQGYDGTKWRNLGWEDDN